jgi:hypothetical protein
MARVLEQDHEEDAEIFYRGHSDVSYELAPSVFRKTKKVTSSICTVNQI